VLWLFALVVVVVVGIVCEKWFVAEVKDALRWSIVCCGGGVTGSTGRQTVGGNIKTSLFRHVVFVIKGLHFVFNVLHSIQDRDGE